MRLFAFFVLLFALAIGSFLYSRTLPHINDEVGFKADYQKLQDAYYDDKRPASDYHAAHKKFDAAYDKLFKAHVTKRNIIKRYSLCFMVLAASGMLLFCRGIKGLKTPPHKWQVPLSGLAAVGLFHFGSMQDVNEFYSSGEYPIWESGRGLYLGLIVVVAALSVLVLLNSLFLLGNKFNLQTGIFDIRRKYLNWVLVTELFITLGLTVEAVREGAYFSLIATPFWLYFYLSILAIRAKAHALADVPMTG